MTDKHAAHEDDDDDWQDYDTALLSQAALAVDWDRPEEDRAWAYLSDVPEQPADKSALDSETHHLR